MISRHEATLHGLDEPEGAMVSPVLDQPASDEELDGRLAKLTSEEQDLFRQVQYPPRRREQLAGVAG